MASSGYISPIARSLSWDHPYRFLEDSLKPGFYLTLKCPSFPVVSFSTLLLCPSKYCYLMLALIYLYIYLIYLSFKAMTLDIKSRVLCFSGKHSMIADLYMQSCHCSLIYTIYLLQCNLELQSMGYSLIFSFLLSKQYQF